MNIFYFKKLLEVTNYLKDSTKNKDFILTNNIFNIHIIKHTIRRIRWSFSLSQKKNGLLACPKKKTSVFLIKIEN